MAQGFKGVDGNFCNMLEFSILLFAVTCRLINLRSAITFQAFNPGLDEQLTSRPGLPPLPRRLRPQVISHQSSQLVIFLGSTASASACSVISLSSKLPALVSFYVWMTIAGKPLRCSKTTNGILFGKLRGVAYPCMHEFDMLPWGLCKSKKPYKHFLPMGLYRRTAASSTGALSCFFPQRFLVTSASDAMKLFEEVWESGSTLISRKAVYKRG